jgi:hypothetical protein
LVRSPDSRFEEVAMAHYTTRVELHGAAEAYYKTLRAAMEELGFSRIIVGHDGSTYEMPTEEYNYEGDIPIDTVLDKAKYAAETTDLECEILVSEIVKRKWHGLKKAASTGGS